MKRRISAALAAALILALAGNANAGALQKTAKSAVDPVAAQVREEISRLLRWLGKEKQAHPTAAELTRRTADEIEKLPIHLAFEPVRDCLKRARGSDELEDCLQAAYRNSR